MDSGATYATEGGGLRDRTDITDAVNRHGKAVMRVCAIYLHEQADREDVFQDTFIKYAQREEPFNDEEHQRAWLLRVAANQCKDLLKSAASTRNDSLEALEEEQRFEVEDTTADDGTRALEQSEVAAALAKLDEKYRVVLYLKYYEDYTAAHIGEVLGIPENTVYTLLSRGKKQLKGVLAHGR